jgi:uncharacterized protein (UPF0261 family)
MRVVAEEAVPIGRVIGQHLQSAKGPTALFIPTKGLSMFDTEDGPFWDPEVDAALVAAVKKELNGSKVEVSEVDATINDELLVAAMVEKLHIFLTEHSKGGNN